jgi:hypothetical protein
MGWTGRAPAWLFDTSSRVKHIARYLARTNFAVLASLSSKEGA